MKKIKHFSTKVVISKKEMHRERDVKQFKLLKKKKKIMNS